VLGPVNRIDINTLLHHLPQGTGTKVSASSESDGWNEPHLSQTMDGGNHPFHDKVNFGLCREAPDTEAEG